MITVKQLKEFTDSFGRTFSDTELQSIIDHMETEVEENEKYKPVHNENFNVSWLLDNVVGDQGTIEIHLENKIIVVDYVSSNFNGSEVLDWNETERSSNDF